MCHEASTLTCLLRTLKLALLPSIFYTGKNISYINWIIIVTFWKSIRWYAYLLCSVVCMAQIHIDLPFCWWTFPSKKIITCVFYIRRPQCYCGCHGSVHCMLRAGKENSKISILSVVLSTSEQFATCNCGDLWCRDSPSPNFEVTWLI